MTEDAASKPDKQLKKGRGRARRLYDGKRSLAAVEKDFYKFVESDKELNSIFKMAGEGSENPLIAGLRADLLSQLHQLVELVLLASTDPTRDSADDIESRLATLLGPRRVPGLKSASLKLVDGFLADKAGEATLKAAVEVVKPFFFGIVKEKLDEETGKVLAGFNADEGGSREVLEWYLFSKANPGVFESNPVLDKLRPSHARREQMHYLQSAAEDASLAATYRGLLQDLGRNLDTASPTASIKERIAKIMENQKLEQRALYTFESIPREVRDA